MIGNRLGIGIGVLVVMACVAQAQTTLEKIAPPPKGKLYHGVFPGKAAPDSPEQIIADDVDSYYRQAGKDVAIVQFYNDWEKSPKFPRETVQWIADRGSVPHIRLTLPPIERSATDSRARFELDSIIQGHWDGSLKLWAQEAKSHRKPLIVEFGTECNGHWFHWCGVKNGGGVLEGFGDPKLPDGPERFVRAYRHLIDLIRDDVGAANITWLFHVNYHDDPNEPWNHFENYFPDNAGLYPKPAGGRGYVDWLAVSCYGPQKPLSSDDPATFAALLDDVYPRLHKLAPGKPIYVAEFGCTSGYAENHPMAARFSPGVWATDALAALFQAGRWPDVIGFSWWNSSWKNDCRPENDSNMRLESTYVLSSAFRTALEQHKANVVEYPVIDDAP